MSHPRVGARCNCRRHAREGLSGKGWRLLGLADGAVLLVEYDPGWVKAFEWEQRRIGQALAGLSRGIQHFGSTAVPGMKAKPILDILVGTADLQSREACIAPLRGLGYDYLGGDLVPGSLFFARGKPRTHHLHVVEWHGPSWTNKVLFRDRLRAEPALAQVYKSIKLALAARYPGDRELYTRGKEAFIGSCMAKS